jgi:hypothetical protein
MIEKSSLNSQAARHRRPAIEFGRAQRTLFVGAANLALPARTSAQLKHRFNPEKGQ